MSIIIDIILGALIVWTIWDLSFDLAIGLFFPEIRKRAARRRRPAPRWWAFLNLDRVLNLFAAFRHDREHPRRVVQTDRYKAWLAQRDAHEPVQRR